MIYGIFPFLLICWLRHSKRQKLPGHPTTNLIWYFWRKRLKEKMEYISLDPQGCLEGRCTGRWWRCPGSTWWAPPRCWPQLCQSHPEQRMCLLFSKTEHPQQQKCWCVPLKWANQTLRDPEKCCCCCLYHNKVHQPWTRDLLILPVFRIRIRPDPKLFGLKDPDPDPKLLISDPDPAPDPDPPLFHTKLKNMF